MSTTPPEGELPPAYDEFDAAIPAYDGDGKGFSGKEKDQSEAEKDGDGREQPSIHYIKPEETLRGLALKYRVDGHLLCRSVVSFAPSHRTRTNGLLP
ncbi:hypothetical protein MNV49_005014 [Pseudohyphozyma bogoriensis]|nr:hypothetical protein MNV49_005014 [Pseudohyphozyma bogoriensis]